MSEKLSIAQIKLRLSDNMACTPDFLELLTQDERAGVKKLLAQYHRAQEKKQEAILAFQSRFTIEEANWEKNQFIAGIDEVGRGPLAGPVVAAAVVLRPDFSLLQVNDSKKLSKKMRDELFLQIIEQAVSVGIGIRDARVIDEVNIYEATRLAMRDAVLTLDVEPSLLLVDAMQVPVNIPQERLIKGDQKSNSIAAASIVAKVMRDRLMDSYAMIYPEYNFDQNAGYGTSAHLDALAEFGVTPIHRQTFQPVPKFLANKYKS